MKKLRVIEFEGLAPSVFCGLYFADVDADVIFVARAESASFSMPFASNILNRNKQCIQVNFKDPHELSQLKELIKTSDIVIDPFRPGVLEKLKLGPKDLYELNKRIILLRVSGYGQTGINRLRPGHDLNYIGTSGILPLINSEDCQFPSNYLADFVSASLGITGVLGALHVREASGEGGVVDCSLTDGCTYLAQSILKNSQKIQEEKIKTFKIGQKQYIASGSSILTLKNSQILQILNGKAYFRSENGDLQISEVQGIGPFQLKQLQSPFNKTRLDHFLRQRGEDTVPGLSKLNPKL